MSLMLRRCIQPAFQLKTIAPQSCMKITGCFQTIGLLNPDDKHCILAHSSNTYQYIHTTSQNFQGTHAKKKIDKKKNQTAYIKPGMSIKKLAFKLKVPEAEILECLQVLTETEYQSDQALQDVTLLKKTCKMLERNYVIVDDKKKAHDKQQIKPKQTSKIEVLDIVKQPPAADELLKPRSPVVTIMGHVDHGKTTLLDALRQSSIVDKEFGGITQHVGAFVVNLDSGHSITFLDTPGHEAFTAMRARGASVTDIVILVIAAEDGIMPQTIESIQHAKNANVPLIVAINKIDKQGTDVTKIKHMLASYDVVAEEFGGDVQIVPISALKRINLDQLEEAVITLSELLELKASTCGSFEGSIIETRTSEGRGKLATVLVQRGILKKGSYLISGNTWTKVRGLYDCNGKQINEALPSTPVEVDGWKEFPLVGDDVLEAPSQKSVVNAVEYRLEKQAEEKANSDKSVIDSIRKTERETYQKKREEKLNYFRSLKSFSRIHKTSISWAETWMNSGKLPENEEIVQTRPKFHIIIKGDVAGSVEAIEDVLGTFRSDMCDIDIVHSGIGEVTQYDIELAEISEGVIFAFNVGVGVGAQSISDNVPIKHHNVIYHLFDDLIKLINDELPTTLEEEIIGQAVIKQKFDVTTKVGKKKQKVSVAGCTCESGNLDRKHLFKVIRNDEIIVQGKKELNTIHSQYVNVSTHKPALNSQTREAHNGCLRHVTA
ncbi:Translation initiation factor IF-2 [Mactra antiquata]